MNSRKRTRFLPNPGECVQIDRSAAPSPLSSNGTRGRWPCSHPRAAPAASPSCPASPRAVGWGIPRVLFGRVEGAESRRCRPPGLRCWCCPGRQDVKTTRYFDEQVSRKRPYARRPTGEVPTDHAAVGGLSGRGGLVSDRIRHRAVCFADPLPPPAWMPLAPPVTTPSLRFRSSPWRGSERQHGDRLSTLLAPWPPGMRPRINNGVRSQGSRHLAAPRWPRPTRQDPDGSRTARRPCHRGPGRA